MIPEIYSASCLAPLFLGLSKVEALWWKDEAEESSPPCVLEAENTRKSWIPYTFKATPSATTYSNQAPISSLYHLQMKPLSFKFSGL